MAAASLMPRRRGRATRVAPTSNSLCLTCVLALGGAIVLLTLLSGWPYWRVHPFSAVATAVSSGVFAVAGGLLATAPRFRRTGVLFVAAVTMWSLNWLLAWNYGPWPQISELTRPAFYLAVGVGVLSYPHNRLAHRVDRLWTAAGVLVLGGGQVAVNLSSQPEWNGYRPDVFWITAAPDITAFDVVLRILSGAYLALAIGFALILLLRLPRQRPLERALVAPVMIALLVVGILAALSEGPVLAARINLDAVIRTYVIQGGCTIFVPFALLGTAMRSRWNEMAVAGRVLNLTAPASVVGVRNALRTVLRDDSLDLLFWAPDQRTYVDVHGRPAPEAVIPEADAEDTGRWRTRIDTAHGDPLAVIEADASLNAHAALVDAALVAAGRALETAQLQAMVQAHLEDTRAAQERLVRAESVERTRLARDLHDGAQQRLLALAAMLSTLAATTGEPETRAQAVACRAELLAALAELRDLARGIHPAILTQDGLAAALETVAERLGARVDLDVTSRRFPADIEATLYFALCEALSNAAKHAGATKVRVSVRVREEPPGGGARPTGPVDDAESRGGGDAEPAANGGADGVARGGGAPSGASARAILADPRTADGTPRHSGAARVTGEVSDDGVGGAVVSPGGGLAGIADRVHALRGTVTIDSEPGRGTTVRVELPCG